jgi:hypothetical protein
MQLGTFLHYTLDDKEIISPTLNLTQSLASAPMRKDNSYFVAG